MFHIRLFKKTKRILQAFRVKISLVGIKVKLLIIKNWSFGVVSIFDLMHLRLFPGPSGRFLKKEANLFQFHLTKVK